LSKLKKEFPEIKTLDSHEHLYVIGRLDQVTAFQMHIKQLFPTIEDKNIKVDNLSNDLGDSCSLSKQHSHCKKYRLRIRKK